MDRIALRNTRNAPMSADPHMPAGAGQFSCGRTAAGLNTLDILRRPTFVLDCHGLVRLMNRSATDILGPDLGLSQGRLRASDGASQKRLRVLVDAVVKSAGATAAPACGTVLVHRIALRPLVVEGMKAEVLFAQPHRACRAVLLFTDLEPGQVPAVGHLRHVFGLTPAEARLAAQLASGASVSDASRRLGIARATARSQLKQVFIKTDTHRQAELVSLLGRLAGPVVYRQHGAQDA